MPIPYIPPAPGVHVVGPPAPTYYSMPSAPMIYNVNTALQPYPYPAAGAFMSPGTPYPAQSFSPLPMTPTAMSPSPQQVAPSSPDAFTPTGGKTDWAAQRKTFMAMGIAGMIRGISMTAAPVGLVSLYWLISNKANFSSSKALLKSLGWVSLFMAATFALGGAVSAWWAYRDHLKKQLQNQMSHLPGFSMLPGVPLAQGSEAPPVSGQAGYRR